MLTLCGTARAQDADVDAKKYPPRLVLSMGLDKWLPYYAKHEGLSESERTDRTASYHYAYCLTGRDDALIAKLPAATAKRVRGYRAALHALHSDALEVARTASGGGSIYLDFFAGAAADDEQAIHRIIPLAACRERGGSAGWGRQAARIRRSLTAKTLRIDFARLTALLPSDRPREARAVLAYATKVKDWPSAGN